MDQANRPIKPGGDDAEVLAARTGGKGGLECPTCGDRFPSQAGLDEHLPNHKVV